MIKKKNNILKEITLSTVVLGTMMGTAFLGQQVHADTINSSNNLQSEDIKVNNADSDVTQVHTITETINYIYQDGSQAAPTKTTSLSFARVDIEKKTNDVIVNPGGAWNMQSQTFKAVASPLISGYQADSAEISAQIVNPDSQNLTFTVTYSPVTKGSNVSNQASNDDVVDGNANKQGISVKNDDLQAITNTSKDDQNKGILPQTGVKQTSQLMVSLMGLILALLSIVGLNKKAIEKL